MMQSLAGAQDPAVFAEHFLRQLSTRQIVNGFVSEPTLNVFESPPANDVQGALDRWCRGPTRKLDLSRAPFRLLAIVNRPDVRMWSTELGELRFIYTVLKTDETCRTSPSAMPQVISGTGTAIIVEFAHPAAPCAAQLALASRWRQLSLAPFGASYNCPWGSTLRLSVVF